MTTRLFRSLVPFLPVLLAATATATATATAQNFTLFGTGCQSGLALGALNTPRIGRDFAITYTGPQGSSFVGLHGFFSQPILLLGRSTTMAGGTPLPHTLPVSMTGGPLCQVLVSPDVILPLPLPTTTPPPWVITVAIPASPSLVGFTFHAQWLTVTERSYMGQPQWVRVATSQAGTAVIGP